jgi:hypothetical protein
MLTLDSGEVENSARTQKASDGPNISVSSPIATAATQASLGCPAKKLIPRLCALSRAQLSGARQLSPRSSLSRAHSSPVPWELSKTDNHCPPRRGALCQESQ